jgi:molybdopterin synthase sulfur carrier subunit
MPGQETMRKPASRRAASSGGRLTLAPTWTYHPRAVPHVAFTSALQRHVEAPPEAVEGGTVRAALEAYFARHAAARAYVLDEQGALRQHVVVFVDGAQVRSRGALDDAVSPGAEIYVMQALSGG